MVKNLIKLKINEKKERRLLLNWNILLIFAYKI